MFQYFVVNKPYGMLSQFTPEGNHATLAQLDFTFPKDVYPVGRLDADSEGLLLLTNDNRLKTDLLSPKSKAPKTYWVQVEGSPTAEAMQQLQAGVQIKHEGKIHKTLPAQVKLIETPTLWERTPPVRFRQHIPTTWLAITLIEGKNRQVRKMTAAVGFPTLRLVRVQLGGLTLGTMQPAAVRSLSAAEVQQLLKS